MEVKKTKYLLSVRENGEFLFQRKPFDDFAEAIEACTAYYRPKIKTGVLSFTMETVAGKFARAFAELNRPEDIKKNEDIESKSGAARYHYAAKHSNIFHYDASLFFMVESEFGAKNADDYFNDER